MQKQLREIIGTSTFDFYTVTGPDGEREIDIVIGLSLCLGKEKNGIEIDLEEFRNAYGQTVADVIFEEHEKIEAQLAEQDRIDREEAEYTKAEDQYYSQKRGGF